MQIIDVRTTPEAEIITTTCDVLEKGGLILFPTETTYGAGVDATNPAAVEKLLAYKSRREGKPLSIAVKDKNTASEYVIINSQAEHIIDQFLPGPVTVVCKDKGKTAPGVASEFGTIGIRIPDHQLLLAILEAYGKPVTATSANASGKRRPYAIPHVLQHLSGTQKENIDLILDAGELPPNPPSTVIDTTLETPITLRQGTPRFTDESKQFAKTHSEQETMDLAGKLVLKHWNDVQATGLILTLDGPLGVGKTVFTKGIAQFLTISEIITSPTYSYVEEYAYTRHTTSGMLYHADLWKVAGDDEVSRLALKQLVAPNNILVVEWSSIAQEYLRHLSEEKKSPLVALTIEQAGETRTLHIAEKSYEK